MCLVTEYNCVFTKEWLYGNYIYKMSQDRYKACLQPIFLKIDIFVML